MKSPKPTRTEEEMFYWDNAVMTSSNLMDEYIVDKRISVDKTINALKIEDNLIISNYRKRYFLEIGCGIGRITEKLKYQYPSVEVIGVDISTKMLELAEAKNINNSLKVTYLLNEGRDIPVPNNSIDFIYTTAVFQHIPNQAKEIYINEAYRALKIDGIFRLQYVEGVENEPFSIHITEDEITDYINKAGFTILDIDRELIFKNWTWITAIKI